MADNDLFAADLAFQWFVQYIYILKCIMMLLSHLGLMISSVMCILGQGSLLINVWNVVLTILIIVLFVLLLIFKIIYLFPVIILLTTQVT